METLRIILEKIIHAVKFNHLFTKENQIKSTHDDIVEIHTEKKLFQIFQCSKESEDKDSSGESKKTFFFKKTGDG